MAKQKSTAEELLDLISGLCFYLPVWAILLVPLVCGGGSYLLLDYLMQNKFQTLFAGSTGATLTNTLSLAIFALTSFAALKGFLDRKKRKALLAETKSLDELKSLSWREFELLVAETYRSEGFSVTEMGGNAPDGGIDLTATTPSGELYLIQCKHYQSAKVGVKIVREMLGVLSKEGASKAVVIATGEYTKDAVQFAQGQPVELVDGRSLLTRIQAYNTRSTHTDEAVTQQEASPAATETVDHNSASSTQPTIEQPANNTSADCPKCGSELVERTAKRGANAGNTFLGCSNFPKCRYTAEA